MTLGECKKQTLQLAFGYSLAGTEIPDTYNNQADYLGMIPGLINAAAMEIATRHRRIPASAALSTLTKTASGEWDIYRLPEDCWQIMSSGLLDMDGRERFHAVRYRLDGTFCVPAGTDGSLILEYWRYPVRVTGTTADTAELDGTRETQECLPYYAAYGILLYDDPYRAQVMFGEYEKRIGKLTEPVWLEVQPISNRYRGE